MRESLSTPVMRRAFGALILAFLMIAGLLMWEVQALRGALQSVDHADEVVSADRELLRLNLDMETSLRGYMLTGKQEFLEPFRTASIAIEPQFTALNSLFPRNGKQKARLAAIRSKYLDWRRLSDPVATQTWNDPKLLAPKKQLDALIQRKVAMDAIREDHAELMAAELQIRGRRLTAVRNGSALVNVLLALLFFFGASGVMLPFIWRMIGFGDRSSAAHSPEAAHPMEGAFREGRASRRWTSWLRSGALVAGAPLLALLLSLPIKPFSPYPFIMFFAAVSVVTWMESLWYGLAALALSILLAGYFLFPPFGSFAIGFNGTLGLTLSGCIQLLICFLIDSRQQAEYALVQKNQILRRSEQLLGRAESKLRAIVDNVLDGIIMIDSAGNIVSLNPGLEKMFGYEAGEMIGKNVKMLMPEPTRTSHDGYLASYHPTQETMVIGMGRELEGLTKTGRRFPMELTVTETSLEGERLFVGLIRDITERRSAEEERNRQEGAIRKNEELLERTGMLAGVGGWEHDLLTDDLMLSPVSRRIFGLGLEQRVTLDEMIGLYTEEERPKAVAAIERTLTDGTPWDMEGQVIRGDGLRVWVRTVGKVEYADGRPARILGAHQDVTALVMERCALQKANERITLATDGGGIGIWDWELGTGRWVWDAWMFRLYGMEPADEQGTYEAWIARLHPDDREATEQALHDAIQGIHPYNVEFRVIWEDGSVHHLRAAGQVRRDEHGTVTRMLGTNMDITERKRSEDASRQAQAVAEVANRAKSDFMANVSHEIRTPMNAILGLTHLALRYRPDPHQLGYLTKIETAAQSLLLIVNDILNFSKLEAGKLQLEHLSFSLDELLDHLVDVVGQKATQKGLSLVFSIARDTPRQLMGDSLRLGQILLNLVDNAIKFTEHGEIVVTVTADEVAGGVAAMRFSVRDTGIGMTAEQVGQLFQAFSQADTSITRRYGGTGLGLAISKQLCELMGGSISAESKLGVGSTFLLTASFHLVREDLRIPPRARPMDLFGKSVLVISAAPADREQVVLPLRAHGFRTTAVASGEEALSALAEGSQIGVPFDLVLLDWRLPGVDGVELSRMIKDRLTLSRVPAILMIAAAEQETVMSGLNDSALDGFLTRPIDESLLIDTIATIFGAGNQFQAQSFIQAPASLAGRRVLLVEDNKLNRDIAIELLGDLGVVVTAAANGSEGVDRVLEEPFDLVLMDIQMPVMDGLIATKLIRSDSRFRRLPVIAMTAHGMLGDRERSLHVGMNDHLVKPISPGELRDILLRWMPLNAVSRIEPLAPVQLTTRMGVLPDQLLPFDIAAALTRTNGKPKLLRNVLLGFGDQYAQAAPQLRGHLREGRVADAEILAHSIKGSAAMLEARDLTAAAAAVEGHLRSGMPEDLESLIETFEKALAPALAAIHSLEAMVALSGTVEDPAVTAPPLQPRPRILVVDDDRANVAFLAESFGSDFDVLGATEGTAALEIAGRELPEVILLDVIMPGMNGYEICKRLKAEVKTQKIPVIFITAAGDVEAETRGLALGAVDYVTKPINPAAVHARVSNQIKLNRAQEALEKAAEERLATSSEHLASIMDSTSEGILELSHDWTILYGNRNAASSLSYLRLGENFWTCFPDLLGTPVEQHLRHTMTQRVEAQYEHFYIANGQWIRGHIFPTDYGISIFFSNFTSEKLLQEKLALEQLLREKRIETVCHMAGGLAHEINNPLAIIHGRADNLRTLAQDGPISASDVLNGCDSILKTSHRAMKILRGLQGFAFEGKQDPMEPSSLSWIIRQCLELQEKRFEQHNIEVRLVIQAALPPLFCRDYQIEQIITNLLNNAFDAIVATDPEERWVSIMAEPSGSNIVIDVTDSGLGIPEEIKAHVMDPFFSTKEGLGMGIGLSLSSVIAQEHGGSLTLCQETPNTCFRLTLPTSPLSTETNWE